MVLMNAKVNLTLNITTIIQIQTLCSHIFTATLIHYIITIQVKCDLAIACIQHTVLSIVVLAIMFFKVVVIVLLVIANTIRVMIRVQLSMRFFATKV